MTDDLRARGAQGPERDDAPEREQPDPVDAIATRSVANPRRVRR